MASPDAGQPRDRANLVAISSLGAELSTVDDAEEARSITVTRCARLLDADVTLWWSEGRRDRPVPALVSRGPVFHLESDVHGTPDTDVIQALRHHVPRLIRRPDGAVRRLLVPVTVMARAVGAIQVDARDGRTDLDAADLAAVAAVAERLGNELTTRRLGDDLRRRADLDELTALPNRAALEHHLEDLLARTPDPGPAPFVVFLDIDRFKLVNDTFGHAAGDAVLTSTARWIREQVRASDFVARFGGDEFVIVLEDPWGAADLDVLLDRLTRTATKPTMIGGERVFVTLSAGAATRRPGIDAVTMLRHADAAMYAAKRSRVRQWFWYDEPFAQAASSELRIESDLHGALAAGALFCEFQPIDELATGACIAHEALVRWEHATRGRLAPDSFIPTAERCGLIVPLTEQVLAMSLAAAAQWPETTAVSVNVSAGHLSDRRFVGLVEHSLEESGVAPDRLILEITETALMTDRDRALEHLDELHRCGVRIAVDDFGTGYTSIQDLTRIPLDLLKIDRSFVTRSVTPAGRLMLSALLKLGQALGTSTVAEGVETEQELDVVAEAGCTYVQGYLLGRPVPAALVAHDGLDESQRTGTIG